MATAVSVPQTSISKKLDFGPLGAKRDQSHFGDAKVRVRHRPSADPTDPHSKPA